ncbi:DUF3256 family protein [Anaerorudis cellulosivorans]|jgi:hypothetical protein|uniref:DUF3256 family protein n=1 Tax=Anaerorudis cellulosivorans TaxID=3397862 RepID=UPI00221E449B|nr:DUF3256 family protein [Seramator thermalis]MCW1734867.1 DUF3256 family protein [Seramator thermalis]
MKPFFILIFSCVSLFGFGQRVADVFKTMPGDILPGFTEADKTLILVDTGLKIIPYPLGNIERMKYSDSYLQLKTSDIGTFQLKLLPLVNNTKIICVIKTVCGKACDSDIRFYSTQWEKIDENTLLPPVSAESFFDRQKQGSNEYEYALSLLDVEPLSAVFSDDSDDLILSLNYEAYLSEENIAKIKPFIKQDFITLHWTKTSFRP